jgi:quinoprotein dehydrogenase-associated probable ABC transporter substrate-binding protein
MKRSSTLMGIVLAALAAAGLMAPSAVDAASRELRVCAAPDSLPYSNDRLEGFENRIAALVASEMDATVRYTWAEPRRGFVRRTLDAHRCDVIMGVPDALPGVAATMPYYRSSYVFVTARSRNLVLRGFDAPALRTLRIGLEAIGLDGANPPPALALARRGLGANVVGFTAADAEGAVSVPARMVDAVASGEIDVAILWGPLAGYFAKRHDGRLVVTAVEPDPDPRSLPLTYGIALGVRKDDAELKAALQQVLDRRQPEITAILREYAVPLVATPASIADERTATGP